MKISVNVQKRMETSFFLSAGILILSVLCGLAMASLLFLMQKVNPLIALREIFKGSFGTLASFKETLTKAIPLILTSAGLCMAFRGKFWNIGAEGQILCGAIAATWVGLHLGPTIPSWLGITALFLSGFISGALWGLIPAILKVKFHINEAISSLMLNYIVSEFVLYLIFGPWKGKFHYGMPLSDDLPQAFRLPTLPGSRIHWPTLVLAIAAAITLYFLLSRTRLGYEIKVIGENPAAGHYAGINSNMTLFFMMILSGGLAGLAGVGELAGIHKHLTKPGEITSGYGFTAIITAFLAKLNPFWVILSSLFFGGILVGGEKIKISLGLPLASVNIFNGMILFSLIIGDYFLTNKVSISFSERSETDAGK